MTGEPKRTDHVQDKKRKAASGGSVPPHQETAHQDERKQKAKEELRSAPTEPAPKEGEDER